MALSLPASGRMARANNKTTKATENEGKATGTRGGSRGQRGKQGHTQAKSKPLVREGRASTTVRRPAKGRDTTDKRPKSTTHDDAEGAREGRASAPRANRGARASTGAARRGTGASKQRVHQRNALANKPKKTSKSKSAAR